MVKVPLEIHYVLPHDLRSETEDRKRIQGLPLECNSQQVNLASCGSTAACSAKWTLVTKGHYSVCAMSLNIPLNSLSASGECESHHAHLPWFNTGFTTGAAGQKFPFAMY
ncbi:hypothetical protein PoB_002084400 [Plakobranchus ocellatus]|uniref:Uncharacterized protein n=1 Tax=Plakobranchus ocellatus TaxID=259542 RepID=A0AAV3ZIX6_9GAST|nr:hypothetical protein PoB_002084400 [Plakobranchus ocellatus]